MQDFNDEKTIREIFDTTPPLSDGTPDWDTIGAQVSKVNPERGEKYLTIGAEHKANAAKILPGNMCRASRAAERPDVQPRVSVAERSSS